MFAQGKTVFVTVGTTRFDQLIESVCECSILKCLIELGYRKVILQIGSGEFTPNVTEDYGITLEYYRFKPTIQDDIKLSDLVISHAGAGSILETLGARKNLIVVINETLMGNHQLELAYQLRKDEHLYCCNCRDLLTTLKTADFSRLIPFQAPDPHLITNYIDKIMGFTCQT